MRKKIAFDPKVYPTEEVFIEKTGLDRATYYRARKRGYFYIGYHDKEINAKPGNVDIGIVTKVVRKAVNAIAKLYEVDSFTRNDMVQEGILRVLELSGHPKINHVGFMYMVALNAARTFLQKLY